MGFWTSFLTLLGLLSDLPPLRWPWLLMTGAIGRSKHIHGLFATLDLFNTASIIYIPDAQCCQEQLGWRLLTFHTWLSINHGERARSAKINAGSRSSGQWPVLLK